MKLALYVEGATEKSIPSFIKRWLDHQLPQPISIPPVPFKGAQDYLDHFADRIKLALEEGKIHGAIGLIDFYGSGLPYRGATIKEQYRWAKHYLESKVNDPEAWLLSDPSIFPADIVNHLPTARNPETINSTNPPATVLSDLYFRKLNSKYKKPIEGSTLFGKLDPNVAYARCPYLKLLLDDVLALAKSVV